jgi:hypothetical protein
MWLPLVEWWYKKYYHIATRMTPFEAIYGKNPPSVLSYMLGVSKVQEVDNNIVVREAILSTLKTNLLELLRQVRGGVNKLLLCLNNFMPIKILLTFSK